MNGTDCELWMKKYICIGYNSYKLILVVNYETDTLDFL